MSDARWKRALRLPTARLDAEDVAVIAIIAGLAIAVAELAYLISWWAGLSLAAAVLIIWGMRTLRIKLP